MSIVPDTGHIKSLLDGGANVACFASNLPPYFLVLPVLRWAHLLQNSEHKLVAYVAHNTAEAQRVESELSDGSVFVSYFCGVNTQQIDEPRLSQIIQQCVQLGMQRALTVPEGGFDVES